MAAFDFSNITGSATMDTASRIASSAIRGSNTLYPRPLAQASSPTNATHSNATHSIGTRTFRAPQTTGIVTSTPTAFAANPLQLSLVNNLNSNKAHAYVSALDSTGRVVMLTPEGKFYYPPDPGSQTPQAISANVAIALPARGQTMQIAIPDYVEGARVWFADGTLDFAVVSTADGPALVEPTAINPDDASADVNWGFVELTYIASYGLFANLSFVDFMGLPLGMELRTASSRPQLVRGISGSAVQMVCDSVRKQASHGAENWADLCVVDKNGRALRVMSPAALMSQRADAFPGFFQSYVDRVWERYASSPLKINTQSSAGTVSCTTNGAMLSCDGDNRSYAKPTATDIFGCNTGPFAIEQTDNTVHKMVVPRLCAAFNRGTLLMKGGDVQPRLKPRSYYRNHPNNRYSEFVHQAELDGKGYAFAYDDVAPTVEEGVAGTVAAPDPRVLTVFVGGGA